MKIFFVQFFVYSCHLFLISSASVQSVQFSRSVVSDSLWPHESQHARPPCSSPALRVYSNSCPSSWWCHPGISSSVVPFSSCPQSLPASGSFPMSQLFTWGGQSTGVSAVHTISVLYWAHLCMKHSLGISDFLEEISSLSHSIVFLYFFALITEEGFLISPFRSLELFIPIGLYFLFSFAFHFSSFLSYL